MGPIILSFLACLAQDPTQCKRVEVSPTIITIVQCQTSSAPQQLAADWQSRHPGIVVRPPYICSTGKPL
jgi:hypothetical protein